MSNRRVAWMLSASILMMACSRSAPHTRDGEFSKSGLADRGGDVRAELVRRDVLESLGVLDSALGVIAHAVAATDNPHRRENVATAIANARVAYKRVEFAVEHFLPSVARALNGAPVDEIEDEEAERPLRPAEGLQVLEELARGPVNAEGWETIEREAKYARQAVTRAVLVTQAYRYHDQDVFLAARNELARVSILGLGGFDTPNRGQSIAEMNAVLLSLRSALSRYAVKEVDGKSNGSAKSAAWHAFDAQLTRVRDSLQAYAAQPDSLDHLSVLRDGLRPLALRLDELRVDLAIPVNLYVTPWRATAATPFEENALDPWAYAHKSAPSGSASRVALGARLFTDNRLSGSHDRNCASCHQPSHAMTDGLVLPRIISGANSQARPLRNTPTLMHAALQPVQFYDGRVAFLEDQVAAVIEDPREMGGKLSAIAMKLQASPTDRAAFAGAYGDRGDSTVTPTRVKAALATFVRSLAPLNAPFDREVRGEVNAMSVDARRGFSVFMGKARCGTCHFAPTFGGVVPPRFDRVDYEVLGVPSPSAQRLDADRGRGAVTNNRLLEHGFRTPSLRNVAETAPYMHNGSLRTLESVIDFYNAGGGVGRGFSVPNQTLPADSLHLTARERELLIAFMKSLSDDGESRGLSAQMSSGNQGRGSTRGTRNR